MSATTLAPASAPPAKPRPRRLLNWRLLFAAISLIWGFSFLLIKVGTQGFAPMHVSLGRMLFGTAVLAIALVVKRHSLPRGVRTWFHLSIAALFLNALPYTLFAYAETHISSTLTGILNATSPLWGMLIGLVALHEDRPTRRRIAGLVVGFAGVVIVLSAGQSFAGGDAIGVTMAVTASASYAVGWAYLRRQLGGTSYSPLSMSTSQLFAGTIMLAVVAPAAVGLPTALPLGPLAAIIALGALGTGLAYLMQYRLVAEVGPTIGQMVTYFIPVIATIAGVALLGEELSWATPIGATIILIGAALTQSKPRKNTKEAS